MWGKPVGRPCEHNWQPVGPSGQIQQCTKCLTLRAKQHVRGRPKAA